MCAESTRARGGIGEETARKYLVEKGYKILTLNYRLRMGEIDIIARDRDTIVFVEVKAARGSGFGDPLNWVPHWKQKRIINVSRMYLARHGLNRSPVRFDVIALSPEKGVCHVEDAFRPSSEVFM